MFALSYVKFLVFLAFSLVEISYAIPTFEGMIRDYNTDSLVPGASLLHALTSTQRHAAYTYYISTMGQRGTASNLTIAANGHHSPREAPPIFYINNRQLYQLNNESSIFHVNVMNNTRRADAPLRVELGHRKQGVLGEWSYRGTRLFFDYGSSSNTGVFFICKDESGNDTGIFMLLKPGPNPEGCELVTLHSFMHRENFRP